jgi:hypothetical protein
VDTEKLVEDLVAIQVNSVVVYIDVLRCKIGALGFEHSPTTRGIDFIAPKLQVPPRWKCGSCGLDTGGHRLTGKGKRNSHHGRYRLDRLN